MGKVTNDLSFVEEGKLICIEWLGSRDSGDKTESKNWPETSLPSFSFCGFVLMEA